jgi:hypothetical protein
MARSWKGRPKKKRYESAGSVVLGQARLGQAPLSLRKSRWRRRGWSFLLVLAVVVGGLTLWLTVDARFYVYNAGIVGARRVSHEEIFKASELMGLHILWARPAAIEATILEKLPSLESAEVTCRLPSDCSIAVVERQPRVLWNELGQLWWIDEEGAVFPVQDGALGSDTASDAAERWLVTGVLPRDGAGNLDERVRVALTELWTSGEEMPTEFDYAAEHGLSFIDDHGWRVIIGQGAGMGERLRILGLMTGRLESRGVTPRFVDVRFPKAPYYSLVGDS